MNTDKLQIQSVEHTENKEKNLQNYEKRLFDRVKNPAFADIVFSHVVNGGTLITLADIWDVRYSDLIGYINGHGKIKEMYQTALVAREEWEKEKCLQELRAIMSVDIREAYDENGSLKNIKELPANLAAALQSVEVEEIYEKDDKEKIHIGNVKKIKFWDKAKAIELFMKKHGLLVDRVKVQHERTLEEILSASRTEDIVEAQIIDDKKNKENSQETGGEGGKVSNNDSDPSQNFSQKNDENANNE